MKKTIGLLLVLAFCIMASDFWKKPFTQWSDKDVIKMTTESPWAKSASVSRSGLAAPPMPPGGGFGGGAPGGPQGGGVPDFPTPAFDVVARWQTALPIRQAFVRLKYGAEADKSEDAKKVLAEQSGSYEIVLSGSLGAFLP